ncbi:MAG: hypothetical protein ACRYG7_45420 [Janthinobacterium lividum]
MAESTEGFQARMNAILAKQEAESQKLAEAEQQKATTEKKNSSEGPAAARQYFEEIMQRLTTETKGFQQVVPAKTFGAAYELAIANKHLLAALLVDRELIICVYDLPFDTQVRSIGERAKSYVYYELSWQSEGWVWKKSDKKVNLRDIGNNNTLVPYRFKGPQGLFLTPSQMQEYLLDLILLLADME